MRGLTIAMLVALIAFVIAIVSLGLEFFGVLGIKNLILNFSDETFFIELSEFSPPVLIEI
ncbi:MAG: hypothetical protein PVI88_03845 [Nitrosopumilaceae archaeon]|jgi:hypothetical protein